MDKLDRLVTDHLIEGLFRPERLAAMLASLTARHAEKAESVNRRIMGLQREVTDAEDRLRRLYRLVEDGLSDIDEVLKDRLNSLKADRDRAKASLETTKSQITHLRTKFTGSLSSNDGTFKHLLAALDADLMVVDLDDVDE